MWRVVIIHSSTALADACLGFEGWTSPIDVARREPPGLRVAATPDLVERLDLIG